MYKILIPLTFCLGLSGCGLFHQDPTPAMIVVETIDSEFQDTIDALKEIVTNANGIDETTRAQILAQVARTEELKLENLNALRDYLTSLGDLDYKQLFEQLYADYKAIREKLKQEG